MRRAWQIGQPGRQQELPAAPTAQPRGGRTERQGQRQSCLHPLLPVPRVMKLCWVEREAAWAGDQSRGRVGSLRGLPPTRCCVPSGEPRHLHSPWDLLASRADAHLSSLLRAGGFDT